ncbi:MAG TPA: M13 family metallopeptidase, partial [Chitinophagaceae bacterium]|nr:M13 family metallopeptidase [Chitinophagaceae bacterium]
MKKLALPAAAIIAVAAITGCTQQSAGDTSQKLIRTEFMDSSVKPGDNFFKFVNGKWLDTATIGPTETSAGAGLEMYNRTKEHLHSILDSVSEANNTPGSIEQQVGDFYASGIDSITIEKRGYDPVKPYLDKINAFTGVNSILQFESDMQKTNHEYVLGMYVGADLKNSSMNIVNFAQTGLGLPDRDYYFKTDAATIAVQNAYKAYIVKIFMLTGVDSSSAVKKADAIYALEKNIAESHRTNVALRDPQSNYNKWAVADLDKKMPVIAFSTFFSSLGIKADSVNLAQPSYYEKLNKLLPGTPIDVWKAYYTFHVLDDAASSLSNAFVMASFNYHNKTLNGQQQIKPRWERVYGATDAYLGDALGQLYVKRYFTEDAKKRMLDLVNNLQKALEDRISQLDWMSDSTKAKARDKLHAFLKKIGYPDKWRDYSHVTIAKGKYFENLLSCAQNEFAYQAAKIGKPVDRTEWQMTAPTINAYYNPTVNEIVFPAGILQYPFFDENADDALNYGAIGMVIGHEMTHGFDDEGAQFDKDGNLNNWWSKEDYAKFKAKAQQVSKLYSSFTVLDSLH